MDCRSVSAAFDWRYLSTPPCPISCGLSKIPHGGFSPIRLQTTTPPKVCLGKPRLKGTRLSAPSPRVGSDLRVSLRGRGPRAEALGATAGTMSHPQVLPSPTVLLSAGSSVLPPDPPDLAPPRFRGSRLYAALPLAGAPGRPQAFPCFAKISLTQCRLPYAGRTIRCLFPSLPGCYQSSSFGAGLDSFLIPVNPISRGYILTRQSSLHATAWCLVGLGPTSPCGDRDNILAAFIKRVASSRCVIGYVAKWEVATVGLTPTGFLRLQAAPPIVSDRIPVLQCPQAVIVWLRVHRLNYTLFTGGGH